MDFSECRWRKTTDVNRDNSIFELINGEIILLDVGFSDDGALEIAFHAGIMNIVQEWKSFWDVLEEGKKLAQDDRQ